MNHILKSSVASIFAIAMLSGASFAQTQDGKGFNAKSPSMNEKQELTDPATTGAVSGGNMMSGADMQGWKDGKITVVVVSSLNDVDPNRVMLQDRMKANPDEVNALQSSIEANPVLKAQLEAQNVQINNVVAAEKATDGSVTFYVQ
jgi:hypothetical protein